ncbi:MAG: exo-alpha-sialidase [Planctomycetia bacterium]|nr:exo-alpha-sialidase [Planctomycetia bacterium]
MLGADAIVSRGFIFGELPTPSCHASTVVEVSPGTFVAAWFGGQHEGAADVGIWLSRRVDGTWTQPEQVAAWHDPDGSQRPCWNPVLFKFSDGTIALFYKASGTPITWKGLVCTSKDGGKTWSEPEAIVSQPGTQTTLSRVPVGPIKNKPVLLDDGVIIAPSSTEDMGWRVHFERSSDGGRTWQVIGPVNDGVSIGAIQPSILRLGGSRLLAIGRTHNKRVFRVESPDNGLTWSEMTLLDLPNPNSGTDAVTLADGRHLLIYNHSEKERWPLNVAMSIDGETWEPAATLETEPGEYSYPAIIQAADGMVHMTYTWKRKKIAYAILDPMKLAPANR